MRRPLANVFALLEPDPQRAEAMRAALERDGEFSSIWSPGAGWLVACAPLGPTDAGEAQATDLVFVEGRDRVERLGRDWNRRVNDLADRRPEQLDQLPGDFGFLRFTPAGELVAVRSAGGLAPIYAWTDGAERAAVGTRLEYFPRFIDGPFQIDPLPNALFVWWPVAIDGRTVLRDVTILPRGGGLRLDSGGTRNPFVYWDPRPAEDAELRESPEHARELRRLLLAALERDLDPHGGNLIALSGGVDSSALAALAAGTLGRPLSSLSLVSDEPTVLERELGYLEPLTRDLGLTPAHRITLDVDALLRYARAPAPTVAPIVHPVLLALPEVAATQEVTILLGGEDADPVVGHRQGLDDWARETPPWRLRWAELPFGPRDYLRWIRARLRGPELLMPAELPPSLHGDVHAEFTELRDGEARRAREDRRPLHQLAARLRQDAWLAMNWEALTPRGICRSVPFQTREVLELAFRCPARERLGPGTKRLLRNALSGDVPSRNLGRQDKASFGRVVGDEPVPIGVDLPPMAAGLVRDELLASPATPRPLSDVLDVLRCLPAARWLQENASR